jgi:hypothetical protein
MDLLTPSPIYIRSHASGLSRLSNSLSSQMSENTPIATSYKCNTALASLYEEERPGTKRWSETRKGRKVPCFEVHRSGTQRQTIPLHQNSIITFRPLNGGSVVRVYPNLDVSAATILANAVPDLKEGGTFYDGKTTRDLWPGGVDEEEVSISAEEFAIETREGVTTIVPPPTESPYTRVDIDQFLAAQDQKLNAPAQRKPFLGDSRRTTTDGTERDEDPGSKFD